MRVCDTPGARLRASQSTSRRLRDLVFVTRYGLAPHRVSEAIALGGGGSHRPGRRWGFSLRSGRRGVTRVLELNPAVEVARWIAWQQQLILAVASGNQPVAVNAMLGNQILPHRLRPTFRQFLIVFGAADSVRMSIDDDVELGDVGAIKTLRNRIELLACV